MRYLDALTVDANDVERVFLAFAAAAALRGAGAALNNGNAAASVVAGIEVERVADVRAMQMPAEDEFHIEIEEAVDGAARPSQRGAAGADSRRRGEMMAPPHAPQKGPLAARAVGEVGLVAGETVSGNEPNQKVEFKETIAKASR